MKTFDVTRRVFFILLLAAGCAGPTADTPTTPVSNASNGSSASIIAALREAGLTVRDGGTVDQPFFGVPARVYVIDDRDLQLYEFPTATDAESAAAQVAPTGSPIGTTMVTWMEPPHFFRKDRLIVNYIGTSERVLAELQRLLGAQFAGR